MPTRGRSDTSRVRPASAPALPGPRPAAAEAGERQGAAGPRHAVVPGIGTISYQQVWGSAPVASGPWCPSRMPTRRRPSLRGAGGKAAMRVLTVLCRLQRKCRGRHAVGRLECGRRPGEEAAARGRGHRHRPGARRGVVDHPTRLVQRGREPASLFDDHADQVGGWPAVAGQWLQPMTAGPARPDPHCRDVAVAHVGGGRPGPRAPWWRPGRRCGVRQVAAHSRSARAASTTPLSPSATSRTRIAASFGGKFTG